MSVVPLVLSGARLFAVQGSWNYDRLLGLGIGYAAEPLLRDLPGGVDGQRYREALGRAVAPFNAHPYLAGLAVGAVARIEHEEHSEDLARLRIALRGPLGSMGDRLVWTGTLPIASALGLMVGSLGLTWLGPIVLLVVHNAAHLWLRLWGLLAGWRLGRDLIRALRAPGLMVALRFVGPVALVLLGMALPLAASWLLAEFDLAGQVAVVGVFAVTFVVGRWVAPVLRGPLLGLLVAAAVLVGAWS